MGLVLILVGVIVLALGKLGLFRLPGDFSFGGDNWRVYFPLATCLLISVILTAVLWLLRIFRR